MPSGPGKTGAAASAPPPVHLVDASIYIHRGWHRRPATEVDADGAAINALRGFADFLLQLLEQAQPGEVALVFDESLIESPRHAIHPGYKASRVSAPPALRRQCADCRALARAAGLAELASNRFEGDDVLATLARAMRAHGRRVVVVSGDKDLTQIVRTGDQWWDFERDRRLDLRGIERRFGVAPHQMADLLALAGDPADDIPGVPGIGRPTAARLLRRWGDLDGVLANLDGVRAMRFRGAPQVAARLAEYEATVRLARRLTGMFEVDGLPDEPGALVRGAPDWTGLDVLLTRLAPSPDWRARWRAVLACAGGRAGTRPRGRAHG